MVRFGDFFAGPAQQVRAAASRLQSGDLTGAGRAADAAIRRLQNQRRKTSNVRELLEEAWYIRAQVHLRSNESQAAFRAFFASRDRLSDDERSLAYFSGEAAALETLPAEILPLLIGFAARTNGSADPMARQASHRLRKRFRPRLGDAAQCAQVQQWNLKITEAGSGCAWSFYHLAVLAAGRQDWSACQGYLNQALTIDPGDEAARLLMAFSMMEIGQNSSANSLILTIEPGHATRAALLLRAYAEAQRRNPQTASHLYETAHAKRPLDQAALMAWADALLCVGRPADAKAWLAKAGALPPSGRIVLALALSADNQAELALKGIGPLLDIARYRHPAANAALIIAGRHPGYDGSMAVLAKIPPDQRGDRFYEVEGLCYAARGQWSQSVQSWSQLKTPGAPVSTAAEQARLAALAAACNQGDFAGVLQSWARLRFVGDAAGEADGLCRVALRKLTLQARDRQPDAGLASLLKETAEAVTQRGLLETSDFGDLIGRLLLVSGQFAEAISLLSASRRTEARLIAASAALRHRDGQLASELLEPLPDTDPRKARLLAVAAALDAKWDAALALIGSQDADRELQDVVLFLAGRPLSGAKEGASDAACYLNAVALIRDGNLAEGWNGLERIGRGSRYRNAADRLAGWLRLREAGAAVRAGRLEEGREHLLASARTWHGKDSGLSGMPAGDAGLLSLHIHADNRAQIAETLATVAHASGPCEPASCHRLTIFHLSEGQSKLVLGDVPAAIAQWELATSYLGAVLADSGYVREWAQIRSETYGVDQPAIEEYKADIQKHVMDVFEAAAARLDADGAGGEAEQVRSLMLLLEAEIHAASLVAEAGGFEPNSLPGRTLVLGPGLVASAQLSEEFARFHRFLVAAEEIKRATADAERAELGEEGEPAPPDRSNLAEEIGYYFSSLRFPALMIRSGNFKRALAMLEQRDRSCFPLCASNCSEGPLKGCRGRGKRFRACNPAFVYEDGERDLEAAASGMRVTVLAKIAEALLTSEEPNANELKAALRRTMSAANGSARSTAAIEALKLVVRGRTRSLQEQKQYDRGAKIMEIATSIFDDDDLKADLGELYAQHAIQLLNAKEEIVVADFDVALPKLRRAAELSPRLLWVQVQTANVLRALALHIGTKDIDRCNALLTEAHEITASLHREQPLNDEYGTAAARARLDLADLHTARALKIVKDRPRDAIPIFVKALELMQVTPTDEMRERTLTTTNEVREMLSVTLAGYGIDAANERSDIDSAVTLLRAAWLLNPGGDHPTRNLMHSLWQLSHRYAESDPALAGQLQQEALYVGKTLLNGGSRDAEVRSLIPVISAGFDTVRRRIGRAAADKLVITPDSSISAPRIEEAIDRLRRHGYL